LARFFDVNPAPDSGFSIRIFLHTGTVEPAMGLRVCPQGELRIGGREFVSRGLASLWGNASRAFYSLVSVREVSCQESWARHRESEVLREILQYLH
jgi:hypothetical protein